MQQIYSKYIHGLKMQDGVSAVKCRDHLNKHDINCLMISSTKRKPPILFRKTGQTWSFSLLLQGSIGRMKQKTVYRSHGLTSLIFSRLLQRLLILETWNQYMPRKPEEGDCLKD